MPIPRALVDDQQSLDAHQAWEDLVESTCFGLQIMEDVPQGLGSIEEDDFTQLNSATMLRADVRKWLHDNGVAFKLFVAFYENPQAGDKAEYSTNLDLEEGGPVGYFDALVVGEFESRDAAMLFKLTWGGQ